MGFRNFQFSFAWPGAYSKTRLVIAVHFWHLQCTTQLSNKSTETPWPLGGLSNSPQAFCFRQQDSVVQAMEPFAIMFGLAACGLVCDYCCWMVCLSVWLCVCLKCVSAWVLRRGCLVSCLTLAELLRAQHLFRPFLLLTFSSYTRPHSEACRQALQINSA